MVMKCLIKNAEGRKLLSGLFFGADHTLSYAPELERPGVLHCLLMPVHSADSSQAVGLEKTDRRSSTDNGRTKQRGS